MPKFSDLFKWLTQPKKPEGSKQESPLLKTEPVSCQQTSQEVIEQEQLVPVIPENEEPPEPKCALSLDKYEELFPIFIKAFEAGYKRYTELVAEKPGIGSEYSIAIRPTDVQIRDAAIEAWQENNNSRTSYEIAHTQPHAEKAIGELCGFLSAHLAFATNIKFKNNKSTPEGGLGGYGDDGFYPLSP